MDKEVRATRTHARTHARIYNYVIYIVCLLIRLIRQVRWSPYLVRGGPVPLVTASCDKSKLYHHTAVEV